MRRVQILVVALVLPISFSAPGQAAGKVEAKCGDLSPNTEIYGCINTEANGFDKKVIIKEAEIIKVLKEWNMDLEPKNAAIEKFKIAASQFKLWRKTQCNAKAALALGGSGSDPLYDLCRIDIDEFRLVQLTSYKKELESRN